jgi:HK97 family phage major capsid protein
VPVALVDFTAEYDGDTVEIRKGIDHVSDDHELFKRFPARFSPRGSGYARSDRTRSREEIPMNETEMLELDQRERSGEELEPGDVRRLREWRNEREREEREEWLRERAMSSHTEAGAAFNTPTRDSDGRLDAVRSQALRANERADFLPAASREHMEQQIRGDDDPRSGLAQATIALSDRDYYRAFAKWMNDPISGGHEWTDKERAAVQKVRWLERAMALGAGGTGGFLVPYELDPAIIISSAGAMSPLRQIARTVTTVQNEKRLVTSLGVTASWDLEAEQVSDDSPALLQPTITCKKGAAFVPVSYELFEDSDISQQVGSLFADAKAVFEASSFTITASQGPNGLITALVAAGGGTVIATGTNVLAQGDLYANQAALPARWRANAKWMMNLSILNGFRQLPQATGLNYSIISDATSPPTALGWPVYENSSMDGTLTGSAADYLVLSGDFQQYAIVDRLGAKLVTIPALVGANQRPTGQAGFYLHWRAGADVLIPDAFRLSNYST